MRSISDLTGSVERTEDVQDDDFEEGTRSSGRKTTRRLIPGLLAMGAAAFAIKRARDRRGSSSTDSIADSERRSASGATTSKSGRSNRRRLGYGLALVAVVGAFRKLRNRDRK